MDVVSSGFSFFQMGESVPIKDQVFKGEHERMFSRLEKPLIQVIESYGFTH